VVVVYLLSPAIGLLGLMTLTAELKLNKILKFFLFF